MWLQHVPCVSIVLSGPFIHLQLLYVFAWSCAALIIWYTASPLFIWCIYFSVQLQDWFSLFLLQHGHFKCIHLEHVLKSTMCEKVWLGPSLWKTLVRQLLLALGMTVSVPQLASQTTTSVQPEVSQQFSDGLPWNMGQMSIRYSCSPEEEQILQNWHCYQPQLFSVFRAN